ncbi:MAG: hypothetical protein AAF799_20830 [Myxococcota bacterium]
MKLAPTSLPVLMAAATLVACGPSTAETEPGRETGSCIEDECLGDLVCVADMCVDPNAGATDTGTPSVDDSGTGSGTVPGSDETQGEPETLDSVSLLVVLDNSGTMGEEQGTLSFSMRAVPAALDALGVNWRMGITTTDNGNPWCQGTGPEGGALRLTSCRSRPAEFVFNGAMDIDAFEICEVPCPPEWETIEIEPSGIFDDPTPAVRPWVESMGGQTNLPEGLFYEDAVECLLPQGINGCGFESPLESMRSAIRRAQTPGDPNYGFLPPGSLLVVLIVTDEVDCSYNPSHETIFLPEGERVFWSDPDAAAPTSAVCWNAGVACDGADCRPENFDPSGGVVDPATAENDAVLYPLTRYSNELAALDDAVMVTINGIQPGGTVQYEPGTDQDFLRNFGIGAGCTSSAGPAVPPVRIRQLAATVNGDVASNQVSICQAEYDDAVEAIVAAVQQRFP